MMIETDSEQKEQKQPKDEKEYEEEEEYNETIVTLRLPKKYYKTAYAVAHLLGHDSFDEYVSDAVIQNMRMEIGGGGSISVDDVEIETLLGEGLFDR